jgi:ProP effector
MEFSTVNYKEYIASAQQIINKLAELYPRCFVREPWQPQRPIALGIGNQLISAGVITIAETRGLAIYTRRLTYLRAMVGGAARIGLDGKPAGEVSEEHAKCAKASMDAPAQEAQRGGSAGEGPARNVLLVMVQARCGQRCVA